MKKEQRFLIYASPVWCACALTLLILVGLYDAYIYPLNAVSEYNSDRYVTIGYIEKVSEADALPLYYDSSLQTWNRGKILTVNSEQYYIPYGEAKAGDAVELTWVSNKRVVYEYTRNVSFAESDIGTRCVWEKPEPQRASLFENTGIWIARISLCLHIIIVLLLLWKPGKVLADYMVRKDINDTPEILPNILGIAAFSIWCIPMLGITVGVALSGAYGILLIASLMLCGWGWMVCVHLNTQVTVDEDTVTVKKGRFVSVIKRDEIKSVTFVRRRMSYDRRLMITLKNGYVCRFDQCFYKGLTAVYLELNTDTEQSGNECQ